MSRGKREEGSHQNMVIKDLNQKSIKAKRSPILKVMALAHISENNPNK